MALLTVPFSVIPLEFLWVPLTSCSPFLESINLVEKDLKDCSWLRRKTHN